MKNFVKASLVAAAFIGTTAVAAPVFVNIDTFDTTPMSAPDLRADGVPVILTSPTRTLTNNLLATIAPTGNTADVTGVNPGGFLDITNGTGEDSEVGISWNIARGLIPTGATNVGFFFSVLQSDGNPTNVEFYLNGNSISNNNIAGNTNNRVVTFALTGANLAAANLGGVLELRINGTPGWDFSADSLGFSYEPAAVPLPGTLALLGLGILFASRRKNK